jgi:hypothetical protein
VPRGSARSEVHFLDLPEEELLSRLVARNAALPPGTFRIEEERMRQWFRLFEPPGAEELLPAERGAPHQRPPA